MLVLKLCEILQSRYIPKPEVIRSICPKRTSSEKEVGIWDILGFYDARKRKITICDKNIEEYGEKLLQKIENDKTKLTLFLRELVRLHEHAHAFLNTARIVNSPLHRNWYHTLPEDVNEPVVEFIVHCIIEEEKHEPLWIKIFEEADKDTPEYYRNWKYIKDILVEKGEYFDSRPTLMIVPIVKFVRSKVWNSWEDFYNSLKMNSQLKINVLKELL